MKKIKLKIRIIKKESTIKRNKKEMLIKEMEVICLERKKFRKVIRRWQLKSLRKLLEKKQLF